MISGIGYGRNERRCTLKVCHFFENKHEYRKVVHRYFGSFSKFTRGSGTFGMFVFSRVWRTTADVPVTTLTSYGYAMDIHCQDMDVQDTFFGIPCMSTRYIIGRCCVPLTDISQAFLHSVYRSVHYGPSTRCVTCHGHSAHASRTDTFESFRLGDARRTRA